MYRVESFGDKRCEQREGGIASYLQCDAPNSCPDVLRCLDAESVLIKIRSCDLDVEYASGNGAYLAVETRWRYIT